MSEGESGIIADQLELVSKNMHPNIQHAQRILVDKDFMYVVYEAEQGGDLFHRIREVVNFSEQNAAYIIKQALFALVSMHSQIPKIIHRSLRPENLLLSSRKLTDLSIKVSDFGSSLKVKNSDLIEKFDAQ